MSSESSDEDLPDNWVPYCKRREWRDVTPLKQDDGENPVVAIAYSDNFTDIFDHFRAIVSTGEKSHRALELTKDALRLNAANYTVWQYRRDILKAINYDLFQELDFIDDTIKENPKNYQVWHHRRVIVEWLNDSSRELELTEEILDMDAKNYHAWQHRQWAIKTFNLFDHELEYVDRLISQDVRNNSAWNQRFFILQYMGLPADVMQHEITYTMNRIAYVKNNESSWNFLRGLLDNGGDKTLTQYPEVLVFCEKLYDQGNRSPYLLGFLMEIYEELYFIEESVEEKEAFDKKIQELGRLLAQQHDKIRCKYWQYVVERFQIRKNDKSTNGDKKPDDEATAD